MLSGGHSWSLVSGQCLMMAPWFVSLSPGGSGLAVSQPRPATDSWPRSAHTDGKFYQGNKSSQTQESTSQPTPTLRKITLRLQLRDTVLNTCLSKICPKVEGSRKTQLQQKMVLPLYSFGYRRRPQCGWFSSLYSSPHRTLFASLKSLSTAFVSRAKISFSLFNFTQCIKCSASSFVIKPCKEKHNNNIDR